MASLQELLAEDGFEKNTSSRIKKHFKNLPEESPVALPIYICHDKKKNKPPSSRKKGHSVSSSNRRSSMSVVSKGGDGPAIDEVAVRAVVSILSGYIGRYARDEAFRDFVRDKCYSCCLKNRGFGDDNGVFANMELGIESIERIIESPGTKKEMRMGTLRNAVRLLTIVASLNSSENPRTASTCGVPNAHLSACAQLYLSIVYKIEKNDRISARHLLQVFCDAPSLARTHLLSELWEHFFLPHLLHLKIWYNKEVESVAARGSFDGDEKMRALNKAFNEHMDYGTIKFAVYYKDWLKVGAEVPPVPSVPSPAKIACQGLRRRSSDSFVSRSPLNKSLYQAVFGSTQPKQMSMEHDGTSPWDMEEEEKLCTHEDYVDYAEKIEATEHESSSVDYRNPEAKSCRDTKIQFLTCQSDPIQCLHRNDSITRTKNRILPPANSLSRAIDTMSTSESLIDCENAMRVITKTWLDLHGNLTIEKTLSQAAVIEGMLEVLFVSTDDEVLEMTVSVLAELVARNDTNRHIVVYSDPNLNIFMILLKNSSMFLKAGVLLYLLKPEAKQMISAEWVPLVLRVLEFGDQSQTLFSVQCSPQEAGYYLLGQLLTGFDEDKNLENARQVVSIGGLSLLAKRMETGDVNEKAKACSIVSSCVRADGSCRHFLAKNLDKSSLLELLVREMQDDSQQPKVLELLVELICLNRKTQTTRFLQGLLDGWGGLNTMHVLFVHLQKARAEERPMVAAVLLHLDLLGDPLKCSVYRQEAVETIIRALDCQMVSNEKVQEQSARALLLLGGRFSYTGETNTENWLLKEAGFDEINSAKYSLLGNDIVVAGLNHSHEEDDAMQNWLRKTAIALLTSGNKRLLAALADSMAYAIPSLARASLVTVSWLSTYLHLTEDEDVRSEASSIFVPHLVESLSRDKATEERVIASFTLLTLARNSSDWGSKLTNVDKELIVDRVRDLSRATWTANELISVVTNVSSNRVHQPENPHEYRT